MRGAPTDDLEDIKAGLVASVEAVAAALLGAPTSKVGGTWRWGRKGSMAVEVRGLKKGQWFDHESAAGGDLLGLIRREQGTDFPAAVQWALSFLGIGDAGGWTPQKRRPSAELEAARAQREAEAEAERAKRRGYALRVWQEAEAVAGTVGAAYLEETRGIPCPPSGWPSEAIRFHRDRTALILAATGDDGAVLAVQLVYLTSEGQKISAEEAEARKLPGAKQSLGPQDGAAVRLPGTRDVLQLVEGPETGLTAWAATGRETWIALGSLGKLALPPLRRLVVCADDDPRHSPAEKAVGRALGIWRSEGRNVSVATPWLTRRFDKSDLNDLAQREGIAAVRARIELALSPQGPKPPGRKAIPVPLARHRLGGAVRAFFDAAGEYDPDLSERPPPVHGIRVGVGVGKSESARQEAARVLSDMRAKGDKRSIVFAVPTHALGEEQARRFEALPAAASAGLRAAVWRGREASDPLRAGHAMCDDLEAVREAQSIKANPEETVCRSKAGMCPFFESCGYQRQKQQRGDLWFVPHQLIYGAKPKAIPKPAVLVVDEAAWAKGLEGVDGPPVDITLDTLAEGIEEHEHFNALSVSRLRSVHVAVLRALETQKDGPLLRDGLLVAGLNADTGRDGRALSYDRLKKADIHPGMKAEDRRAAVHEARSNRTAMRCARFFTALRALLEDGGPEASGWASLVTLDSPDGPVRAIRVRGRRDVGKHWLAPTLHLDALLNPDLLRPYWPQIEIAAEIEAATPHMRVRQLQGRDWAKSALVPDERCDPAEAERRLKNSERLRSTVWREARRVWPGRVLVVAQKAVEDYWRTAGPIPTNVELAHHNAVAGRDEWGPGQDREGVVSVIVVGRTQPRTDAVERIAEALTGKASVRRCSRYDRQDAVIEMEDGTTATAAADRHPDPMAEAVRWQICEGELIQIIGRGRGVNRTAANPLDVLVLTDRPLPLVIDEAVFWDSLAPTPEDLMLGQGGVALESPTDASRCYPSLWPTPEAAKKAAQRGQWGTSPIRELSNGECPPLRSATYQRAGARQRPAKLLFDPVAVPLDELQGWLEDRLGEMAKLEVAPIQPPPPPPPQQGREAAREAQESAAAAENSAVEGVPTPAADVQLEPLPPSLGALTGPERGTRPGPYRAAEPASTEPLPRHRPPGPHTEHWRDDHG